MNNELVTEHNDHNLISGKILSSIILMIIASCFAVVQQPQFSMIILVFSLSLISKIRIKFQIDKTWLTFILLSFFTIIIGSYNITSLTNNIFNFLSILISAYFAWHIKSKTFIYESVILVAFNVFLFGMIIWVLITMLNGGDYNNITPSGSQNTVTAFILFSLIPFFYFNREKKFKIFILTIFTIILFYEIGGRSSLVSISLACILALFGIRINLYLIYPSILFFLILNPYLFELLHTPRYLIWKTYINCLDFKALLIGVPQVCLENTKVEYFSFNLHNSFIKLHQSIGIGVLFIVALFVKALYASYYLNCSTSFLIILIYIIKLNFDVLAFPGFFDFIIFFILFDIIYRYKEKTISKKNVR